MSTTPNMSMVLPTDHDTTDTWGAVLNTALTLNDAHDHSAGKGVRITQAGINLTGDLSFGVHALTNALAIDMTPSSAAAVAGYSSAVFTNSADNNLYFRNSGGTNVQITAGSALNIAGVSGFGGDYASVGALADFIDANDTYHFYQQLGGGVRQYARMASGDHDFFEFKANPTVGVPTNRVRLKSPAALAASYDVTWLTALPASTAIVLVSATGQISTDTGTGVTASSFHVTQPIEVNIPASMANPLTNAAANDANGQFGITLNAGTGPAGQATFPLPLPTNATLSSVTGYINKATSSASVVQMTLRVYGAGTPASVYSTTATNGGNSTGQATIVIGSFAGIPTFLNGNYATVSIGMQSGAGATDTVYGVTVRYTV